MDEKLRQLIAGPLGRALLESARGYATPLYWSTPKKNGTWTVDKNGSAFILNAGAGPFLVTAGHVYEGYVAAHNEAEKIVCQVGNAAFPIMDRLIENGHERGVDIATFRITAAEIAQVGKNILIGNNDAWPPPEAVVGDAALLAGFPGLERRDMGDRNINFGVYAGLTPVTNRSDRHFGCALDQTYWYDPIGRGMPAPGYDLGGTSGAPVLLVVESRAGVISWSLGGVLYNASARLGEVLYTAHARFIRPDGTLDIPAEQQIVLPRNQD